MARRCGTLSDGMRKHSSFSDYTKQVHEFMETATHNAYMESRLPRLRFEILTAGAQDFTAIIRS